MFRKLWGAALLAVGLFGPAWSAPAASGEAQKIVVFSERAPWPERRSMLAGMGLPVVRELALIDAVVIRVPRFSVASVETRLRSMPEIIRIEDDLRLNWLNGQAAGPDLPSLGAVMETLKSKDAAPGAPKPPSIPRASEPNIPWGISRVNAPKAWAAGKGAGVKVAVIDTGIDATHPDLAANVAGGWSAIQPGGSWADDNNHGTHVSGTIAAVTPSTGIVGVAPQARLYGVKVLDAWGSGTFSDVIAGIDWAATNKMQVVNMSLGASTTTESLHEAVKRAAAAGVTIVCAAGNSGGSVGWPAAYPETIAVSASDSGDRLASFSSRGPEVAFIAPGVDVLSSVPGGGYDSYSGTSMASPHVAGLAALKIGRTPGLKPEDVRKAFAAAATPLKDLTREQQGAGMIDAAKLLGAAPASSGR